MPTCYRHPGRETYIRCQRCDRPICPDCMRDASVGFQCPNCVAEGAKSVRAPRTSYGGLRSTNPQQTSLVLIVLNVVVWVFITATGGNKSFLLDRFGLLATSRCDPTDQSGYYPQAGQVACQAGGSAFTWVTGVADGAYWQLFTSMFTHVAVVHIAFNMLALWVLGPVLESFIGRTRFLALYLLSGLAGSVLVYWLSDTQVQTVGASGAIFGLMGGLVVVTLKRGGNVRTLLMWIGINAAITIFGAGSISWQGHLGGLIGGAVIAAVLVFAPRERRTNWQVAGLGLIGVLLVILTLLRTAQLT